MKMKKLYLVAKKNRKHLNEGDAVCEDCLSVEEDEEIVMELEYGICDCGYEIKQVILMVLDDDGFSVDGDDFGENEFPITWSWECNNCETMNDSEIPAIGKYSFSCSCGNEIHFKIIYEI